MASKLTSGMIGFICSFRDAGKAVRVGPSSLKSAIRHVQPY
jgi:hypothetical protein